MTVDGRSMLELTARLGAAGLLIQSLELIRHWRHLPDHGLFGWAGGAARPARSIRHRIGRIHHYPLCLAALCLRAVAATLCVGLPPGSPAMVWVLGLLFLLQLHFNRRFHLVRENANAMYLIGLAAAVVGLLPGASTRLIQVAAGFVAFQVLLAYFVAGKTKLVSPAWRNGSYLRAVVAECGDRFPRWGAGLLRRRGVARGATWAVIGLELGFPLCVVAPPAMFWGFIAGGLLFHAAITFTMGVHSFWWSFTATYPALYLVHGQLWPLMAQAAG